MEKFVVTMLLIVGSTNVIFSQSYKYEIGGMGGVSFYLGEANSGVYKNLGATGGAVFKYNHNFRYAIKTNLTLAHISGDTQQYPNVFPNRGQAAFSRNVADLTGQIEFNFFNYSEAFRYLDTKSWTPYVSAGLGVNFSTGKTAFFSASIPFGMGVKYKIRPRWNVGIEFSLRKLFQDDLDVTESNPPLSLNDPYEIKSAMYKNKDWLQFTFFFITYDFFSCSEFCK
ncbi:MAG: DUF6089 family protein [Bacteroidales bacterium]|nr:DUF6089 family protein [Bacteroidales bacterium]